ncbi:hypothetical protein F7725_019475 [Dissostichus mawsoni]|uniref:Uncharacterized protein n=1 Tax=Dissostichus mawsoni TaxID=36200 RepID=A0A7J5YJT7_DISMA|nr:hypothetical protein F7725_019475 [Dissostichus mawsoni]
MSFTEHSACECRSKIEVKEQKEKKPRKGKGKGQKRKRKKNRDKTIHDAYVSSAFSTYLHLIFVSHVVSTAQRGESVCSCRIPLPADAPANIRTNTVKNAS